MFEKVRDAALEPPDVRRERTGWCEVCARAIYCGEFPAFGRGKVYCNMICPDCLSAADKDQLLEWLGWEVREAL